MIDDNTKNSIIICGVFIILISNMVTAILVKDIIEERENNKECIISNDSRYCKEKKWTSLK